MTYGSEVVRLLSRANVPARALIRNPNRAQELPGITWVTDDLAKPETLPRPRGRDPGGPRRLVDDAALHAPESRGNGRRDPAA
jgi:hypothetical protein